MYCEKCGSIDDTVRERGNAFDPFDYDDDSLGIFCDQCTSGVYVDSTKVFVVLFVIVLSIILISEFI